MKVNIAYNTIHSYDETILLGYWLWQENNVHPDSMISIQAPNFREI